MKIFKRTKNIIKSNLHAKLDKLEDPQKMIALMLNELDDALIEAKKGATQRLAARSLVQEEITKTKAALKRWEKRIVLAVESGDDELAKEAIAEKNRIKRELERLEEQYKHLQEVVDSLQGQVDLIEAKKREIKEKEIILIQRATHAKEKKKIYQILNELESNRTLERFSKLEEQIEKLEAEAKVASWSTKEATFTKMEEQSAVDQELAKLKEKHSKTN